MKDYFVSEIQGHKFHFSRVTNSSFDIWYHVATDVNEMNVTYRMNRGKQDKWKITTLRMPSVILGYEDECGEAIQINENDTSHGVPRSAWE